MDNAQATTPVNYIELTLKQAESVEQAADRHKDSPGEDTALQLEIELEKLCFYQVSAKGKPNVRARLAAESARASVLGRVITQPSRPK